MCPCCSLRQNAWSSAKGYVQQMNYFDIIKDTIGKFVTHTGQKFLKNLIQKTKNAMKEKIATLNYFDAFNIQSKADHAKNISELAKYYGQPKQDIFEGKHK